MAPLHKELIARFKTLQELIHFMQVYHSILVINRLHYFPTETSFENLSPAEKNLYTTVLIRPAPNAQHPAELIAQVYQQLNPTPAMPSVVAYVHYSLPFALYEQGAPTPPEQDQNAWWFQAINCQNALLPYTIPENEKIKVASIDTGILYNHPDLDDFRRKGVARDFTQLKWADGQLDEDYKNGTEIDLGIMDTGDSAVHGTHIAGLIGALRIVTSHTIGLAHQATLLNFRAWDLSTAPSDATLAVAVRSAADMGAKVINASWGRAKQDATNECALSDAINYACTKGAVVVCAAGNFDSDIDGYIPARFKNVIVVGSVDIPKKPGGLCNRSEDSNFGDRVIGAPGVDIFSLDALDTTVMRKMSGTSMAAAIVSGLVARMIEINPQLVLPPIDTNLPCNAAEVILGKIKTVETDKRDSHPFNMINVDETLRQLTANARQRPQSRENSGNLTHNTFPSP